MPKVLIVEDDEQISALLKIYFNGLEIDADLIHNPLDALEKLKISNYDIVVIDINMKPISGLELINKMHETNTTAKITLMSGSFVQVNDSFDHLKTDYKKYKIDSFLPKPFLMSDIFKVLTDCGH